MLLPQSVTGAPHEPCTDLSSVSVKMKDVVSDIVNQWSGRKADKEAVIMVGGGVSAGAKKHRCSENAVMGPREGDVGAKS